jgi:hypothetical protein
VQKIFAKVRCESRGVVFEKRHDDVLRNIRLSSSTAPWSNCRYYCAASKSAWPVIALSTRARQSREIGRRRNPRLGFRGAITSRAGRGQAVMAAIFGEMAAENFARLKNS